MLLHFSMALVVAEIKPRILQVQDKHFSSEPHHWPREYRVHCERVEKTQAIQSRVQSCIKLLKTGLFIHKCMKLNTETLLKYYILQILIQ